MAMELHLARPNTDQAHVIVTCDGAFSHTFDRQSVIPTTSNGQPYPLKDPFTYGKALYAALFPPDSLASGALATRPQRIVLVAADEDLDAISWEYACGPDGLLACRCSLVRGLPKEERIAPPGSLNGLHIVAVASSPLSRHLAPLNVEGEWTRLTEIIYDLDRAVRLERAWPPTIERLRDLVVDGSQRVVHFMGHGGQNAAGAVLFHGDFYKAAVAACGCHDNRMDKASWNEQWMGYPVGPQYAASSNIDHAANLRGKLLLIVGELDENVPPESTLRLVDALIKAGKDFDFLMVPGMGHSNGGPYGTRRMQDFFVRHLQGVEPPDRNAPARRGPEAPPSPPAPLPRGERGEEKPSTPVGEGSG